MDFEKFKKEFDASFAEVIPEEFVKKMEELGYKFEDIETEWQNEKKKS